MKGFLRFTLSKVKTFRASGGRRGNRNAPTAAGLYSRLRGAGGSPGLWSPVGIRTEVGGDDSLRG